VQVFGELLAGLPSPVIRDFAQRTTLTRRAAGEVLFEEGTPVTCVSFLTTGRAKVTREGEHGRRNLLIVAGPGDMLGQLSVFRPERHVTTVVALTEMTVAQLAIRDMRTWLERWPEANAQFITFLIHRAGIVHEALNDSYGRDIGARVAQTILHSARRFGRLTAEGTRVNLLLNQEEIAQHVRASRAQVNKSVLSFVRAGWIRKDGSDLVIIDCDRLSDRAGTRAGSMHDPRKERNPWKPN
jgi:CRP/FNR family cyclic AMP-dependent transcriptional regulator